MFALLFVVLAQDSDAETLELIREAVSDNHAIDSLELRYHFYDPETKERSPNYTWAFQGQSYLHSYDGGRCFHTGRAGKDWISFDGVWNYHVQYQPNGGIRAVEKQELSGPARQQLKSRDEGMVGPLMPLGWRLPTSDQSLAKLLERARLIGKEEIDGHPCWKVDLGENSWKGIKSNRVTAWFDQDVGYWPRKIEIQPVDFKAGQPNTLKPGQIHVDFRNIEFARIEDAETGEKRWFPKRCQIDDLLHKKVDIVLEEIRLNHAIPSERFVGDLPE